MLNPVEDREKSGDDCAPLEVAADGSWALYELYGTLGHYVPVIHTNGGWSAMLPILDTWEGNELTQSLDAARLDTWAGPTALGELLVFELETTTAHIDPAWLGEDHHRRVVICARAANEARCAPPIIVHFEREQAPDYEYDEPKLLRKFRYEAKLRVKGEDLVVTGSSAADRDLAMDDSAIFLAPGRYALSELLTSEPYVYTSDE